MTQYPPLPEDLRRIFEEYAEAAEAGAKTKVEATVKRLVAYSLHQPFNPTAQGSETLAATVFRACELYALHIKSSLEEAFEGEYRSDHFRKGLELELLTRFLYGTLLRDLAKGAEELKRVQFHDREAFLAYYLFPKPEIAVRYKLFRSIAERVRGRKVDVKALLKRAARAYAADEFSGTPGRLGLAAVALLVAADLTEKKAEKEFERLADKGVTAWMDRLAEIGKAAADAKGLKKRALTEALGEYDRAFQDAYGESAGSGRESLDAPLSADDDRTLGDTLESTAGPSVDLEGLAAAVRANNLRERVVACAMYVLANEGKADDARKRRIADLELLGAALAATMELEPARKVFAHTDQVARGKSDSKKAIPSTVYERIDLARQLLQQVLKELLEIDAAPEYDPSDPYLARAVLDVLAEGWRRSASDAAKSAFDAAARSQRAAPDPAIEEDEDPEDDEEAGIW